MFDRLARRALGSIHARLGPDLRVHQADLVARNFEEVTYRRLNRMGFAPGGYIDIGAYHGDWTKMAHRILGVKPTLMVEGQAALLPNLSQLADSRPGLRVEQAVLASEPGREVVFHEMGTGSSIFAEASNAPRSSVTVKTRILDDVAAGLLAEADDIFLKIDVQGAELEVLAGATRVLEQAALVQLEVAMLPYNAGAPLMPDVIAWMAERGWLPTEISGFSRPSGPLVQIDMLFARDGSPLRPQSFRY